MSLKSISLYGITLLFLMNIALAPFVRVFDQPKLMISNHTNIDVSVLLCDEKNMQISFGIEENLFRSGNSDAFGYTLTNSGTPNELHSQNLTKPRKLNVLLLPAIDSSTNKYPLGCNTANPLARETAVFDGKSTVKIRLTGGVDKRNDSNPITANTLTQTSLYGENLAKGLPIDSSPMISLKLTSHLANPVELICMNGEVVGRVTELSNSKTSLFAIPSQGEYTLAAFENGVCGEVVYSLVAKNFMVYSANITSEEHVDEDGEIQQKIVVADQNQTYRFEPKSSGIVLREARVLCINGIETEENFEGTGFFALNPGKYSVSEYCLSPKLEIEISQSRVYPLERAEIYNSDFSSVGFLSTVDSQGNQDSTNPSTELKPIATELVTFAQTSQSSVTNQKPIISHSSNPILPVSFLNLSSAVNATNNSGLVSQTPSTQNSGTSSVLKPIETTQADKLDSEETKTESQKTSLDTAVGAILSNINVPSYLTLRNVAVVLVAGSLVAGLSFWTFRNMTRK
jgi:hypothetical protein